METEMKMIVLVLGVYLGTCCGSLAQGSGGSSGGGGSSTGAGSSLSNGSTLSGTGGAPGPNTSNAQRHGTTGNNMGAPSNPAPGARDNAVSTPAADSAMQTLGRTDTGILGK
jgi:hypothetical protein